MEQHLGECRVRDETAPNVSWLGSRLSVIIRSHFPIVCVGVSTSKRAVYVGVYSASYSKPRQKSPAEDGPRDERTTGAGMGKRGSARGLDTWGFWWRSGL